MWSVVSSLGYLDDFGDFLVVLDQVVGLGE